jgi:hypothetical protein
LPSSKDYFSRHKKMCCVSFQVVPTNGVQGAALTMDMVMLSGCKGQERTQAKFAALLEPEGLSLRHVDSVNSGLGLLYARKA